MLHSRLAQYNIHLPYTHAHARVVYLLYAKFKKELMKLILSFARQPGAGGVWCTRHPPAAAVNRHGKE
jgi:hypothetical protein